jgi:hypothetical protein
MSLCRDFVAPGHDFELGPDGVHDGNHRACLHGKRGEHRAELVNRQRIVAVHQQMPAPISYPHHEELDLEIFWRLPLTKHLQDSFCAVSYSAGDPCGRSFQLITYFIASPEVISTDNRRVSLLLGDEHWAMAAGLVPAGALSRYLQSTLLSCAAAICHLPSRFNQVSVQTWHCFASGFVLSLPMACSLP